MHHKAVPIAPNNATPCFLCLTAYKECNVPHISAKNKIRKDNKYSMVSLVAYEPIALVLLVFPFRSPLWLLQ